MGQDYIKRKGIDEMRLVSRWDKSTPTVWMRSFMGIKGAITVTVIGKEGKGIVAVAVGGVVGQREDTSQKEKTGKVRQECDKADQSGVAAEERRKPARARAFGESEVQR